MPECIFKKSKTCLKNVKEIRKDISKNASKNFQKPSPKDVPPETALD